MVGEINLPACRFITEKNILPQHYINKKNNDFISVIYSAIFSKYNERLIKFLENNKDNNVINSLLGIIKKLKKHIFFININTKYTIPELKYFFNSKEDTIIYQNKQDLIKKLFFLINNLISFDYKLNVKKKTIYLEKNLGTI